MCWEGIVGGMHGGHYRLYLLRAGGGMVANGRTSLWPELRGDAGQRGASPDVNVTIAGLIRS